MKFYTWMGIAKKVINISSLDFYGKIWKIADKEGAEHTGVCMAASCYWGMRCVEGQSIFDFNSIISEELILSFLWNAQKLYEEVNPGTLTQEIDSIYTGFRIADIGAKNIENTPVFERRDFAFFAMPEHFKCLPENAVFLVTNHAKEKDGHAVAFYKKEKKIYFFDVNSGIYEVKNLPELLNTGENKNEIFSMEMVNLL